MAEITNSPTFAQEDIKHQFRSSHQKELTGLLEKGVFQIVNLADVHSGSRLFNSWFIDEIKNLGTFEKSRLIMQAYNDDEKKLVLTQSPTIQHVSQCIILCIAAMKIDTNVNIFLRNISQAYVQSNTNLNREFYVRPPQELEEELGIGKHNVLKVLKPLYGVPEADNHWFKTYHTHHIEKLNMDQSTYDPCLMYSNTPFGIVSLQTDDTLFLADKDFASMEQDKLQEAKFMAKE